MADRWDRANTVNAYVVLKVFPGYRSCANQPDGWHQYAPALREDSQGEFSYTISPGFWLADAPERLSRDLQVWYGNVRAMVASGARFHLITTFNEWGEGTSVESAAEWASDSGYGEYLDALNKNGLGPPPIKVTPTPTPVVSSTPTPRVTTSTTPSITPTPTVPGPTWTATPTLPPSSFIWEDDNFNRLATGPLNNQNGWRATRDSPLVVPYTARGNALWINPSPGGMILIGKDVPDQADGRHRFEFDVMALNAVEASLAKIELKTNPNSGWDRKFQVYFGSSMRVNYSATGASRTLVPSTQSGRWYHLRFEINMVMGTMDAWVDGVLVASGLPMHPGPITALSISSWDRTGSVYLDNLLGYKISSALSVEITEPSQGATVSGTVNIVAEASAEVSRIEFYIDGVLQFTDLVPPYQYAWDTKLNPLPLPNHPMDLGYYFVEWKNPADFDQARAEVNSYSNMYYGSIYSYVSDLTPPEWKALLAQSLANAVAENKRIHLALDPENAWDGILDVAAPFWDDVSRIEVGDEPNLSLAATEAILQRLKAKLAARGLPLRPMGFVYRYDEPLPEAINAPSLNWVGIEAYLDAPGSPLSQANINALNAYLQTTKAQVPSGKQIVLVMMAYDRNGTWPNIDTLRDLQVPVYLAAYNDPRVIAINMFSYTRRGGSRDHPELRTPHRLMGERILDRSIPDAENGPRTIRVVAYGVSGGRASDRITVTVRNADVTPTYTPTPTAYITDTPTPTPTTWTITPTNTPSPTPTAYITDTPTPTATWTPSITPSRTSTPSITPTSSPTPLPIVWEDDPFDPLAVGPLHGKNGWRAVRDSPQVVRFLGRGKVLKVDPGPGRTIIIGKDVPDQSSGRHRFEFDVMVSGATEASLAKIEVQTYPNSGWDKKYQLYFGSSMRINYSGTGAAQTIVASTISGRWYHIRIEMDLNTGSADVWVDGSLAASGIPMHPGPIASLSISGWDRAGEVYLDNLRGSG
jgi:hypothetical protein